MSRSRTLERDWRLLTNGPCLGVDAIVDADRDARRIEGELRLAVGLRDTGRQLPGDVDAAWTAFTDAMGSSSDGGTVVPIARRRAKRRVATVLLAAALSLVPLAGMALAAEPGSPLYGIRRAFERTAVAIVPGTSVPLRVAEARLGDLLDVLLDGSDRLAPAAASELVEARAEALGAGADVRELDDGIRTRVPAALGGIDASTREEVVAILGELLPPDVGGTSPASATAPDHNADETRAGPPLTADDPGGSPVRGDGKGGTDPNGGGPGNDGEPDGDEGLGGSGGGGSGSSGGVDDGGSSGGVGSSGGGGSDGGGSGSGGGGSGGGGGATPPPDNDPWTHPEQTAIVVSYDAGSGTLVVERRSGARQSYRLVGYTEIEWENGDCGGEWAASTTDLVPDAGIVEIDAEGATIGWMSLVCPL